MSLNVHITYKKSAHPPGNRFQRVFDFWYVEMKAHCSLFHLIDPFSWNVGNLISKILYFVKKLYP